MSTRMVDRIRTAAPGRMLGSAQIPKKESPRQLTPHIAAKLKKEIEGGFPVDIFELMKYLDLPETDPLSMRRLPNTLKELKESEKPFIRDTVFGKSWIIIYVPKWNRGYHSSGAIVFQKKSKKAKFEISIHREDICYVVRISAASGDGPPEILKAKYNPKTGNMLRG